jgi:hypothetical protein
VASLQSNKKSSSSSLGCTKSRGAPTKNTELEKRWQSVRNEVLDLVQRGDVTAPAGTEIPKDVLRGITVRPSGKFQAQLYFAGQSRYIGVFDSKQQAAFAYETIRERLKRKRDNDVSTAPSVAATTTTTTRAITPSPTTIVGTNSRHSAGPAATTKLDG